MSRGLFPAFLSLQGKDVLVVGGGAVAHRKAVSLLDCGARVRILSPEIRPEVSALPGVHWIKAHYTSTFLRPPHPHWWIIFAATNQDHINAQVCTDAQSVSIWACNCSDPSAGDLITPATRRVGPIVLAVSTGGASPGLAAQIAQTAAEGISPQHQILAELLVSWRAEVQAKFANESVRRDLMRKLSSQAMLETISAGGRKEAERQFLQLMLEAECAGERSGG
jgi:siroheme synthase-like protein